MSGEADKPGWYSDAAWAQKNPANAASASFWPLDCYWVNYRAAVDKEMVVLPQEILHRPGLKGGIFLIGDASPNPNATDLFLRSPVRDSVPGVVCHACGLFTLLDEKPVLRVGEEYLNWFNAAVAALAVLAGEIFGALYVIARRIMKGAPFWAAAGAIAEKRSPLFDFSTRLVAFTLPAGVALWLWSTARIAWTEVFWSMSAIGLLIGIVIWRAIVTHEEEAPPTGHS
jgi:hypothetical protein